MPFDNEEFVRSLRQNAGAHSRKQCAKFVRQALEAGGADTQDILPRLASWVLALATSFLLCCATPAFAAPVGADAQVVAHLYKDFGWQAFASQEELFGEDLGHQPKEVLERYFSPQLVELITKDAECQARERGLCRLDFDILFDSQDPVITDLVVRVLAPGKAQVRFKNPVDGEFRAIQFVVAKTPDRWRIVDVLYGPKAERSLKQILLK